MSNGNMNDAINPELIAPAVFECEKAQNCMLPMGITSENVAEKYGITRLQQDTMAYESHMKALRAQKEGWTKSEITPYKTIVKDKDGEKQVLIYMNHPLRIHGKTFYQQSFAQDEKGTVLQVVENKGLLVPYITSIIVSLGMIIHFMAKLAKFQKRRLKEDVS